MYFLAIVLVNHELLTHRFEIQDKKLGNITKNLLLTHYQMTNFRVFQIERVCRQQFQIRRKWHKIIQMGRKHCGKGEIAHYEQFLLFPQCFQRACFPGPWHQKVSLCRNGLRHFNSFPNNPWFIWSWKDILKTLWEEGEKAGNQYFFSFSHNVFFHNQNNFTF